MALSWNVTSGLWVTKHASKGSKYNDSLSRKMGRGAVFLSFVPLTGRYTALATVSKSSFSG